MSWAVAGHASDPRSVATQIRIAGSVRIRRLSVADTPACMPHNALEPHVGHEVHLIASHPCARRRFLQLSAALGSALVAYRPSSSADLRVSRRSSHAAGPTCARGRPREWVRPLHGDGFVEGRGLDSHDAEVHELDRASRPAGRGPPNALRSIPESRSNPGHRVAAERSALEVMRPQRAVILRYAQDLSERDHGVARQPGRSRAAASPGRSSIQRSCDPPHAPLPTSGTDGGAVCLRYSAGSIGTSITTGPPVRRPSRTAASSPSNVVT